MIVLALFTFWGLGGESLASFDLKFFSKSMEWRPGASNPSDPNYWKHQPLNTSSSYFDSDYVTFIGRVHDIDRDHRFKIVVYKGDEMIVKETYYSDLREVGSTPLEFSSFLCKYKAVHGIGGYWKKLFINQNPKEDIEDENPNDYQELYVNGFVILEQDLFQSSSLTLAPSSQDFTYDFGTIVRAKGVLKDTSDAHYQQLRYYKVETEELIYLTTSQVGGVASESVIELVPDDFIREPGKYRIDHYYSTFEPSRGIWNLKDSQKFKILPPDNPYCGDEIVYGEEQCDLGSQNGSSCEPGYGETCVSCSADCQNTTEVGPHCGDNFINSSNEYCDDGNTIDNDGCDSRCQIELGVCGNGVVESSEECDDGNLFDSDGCNGNCTIGSAVQKQISPGIIILLKD